MKRKPMFAVLGPMLALFALVAHDARAAENYKIDPVHSSVVFRIQHFGVSYFYGRFNELTGKFAVDDKNNAGNSVEATIKVASLDTHSEKRDADLKGPDFFNAKTFPVITFKGKSFKRLDGGNVEVSGDFTLRGVTKTVTLTLMHVGSGKDPWGGYRSGYEGTLTLKRSDYGMTYMLQGIGDEVTIFLGIEGVRE